MQDGATSWYVTLLGQNFAKAFDVKSPMPKEAGICMGTWGVSTRLMGALVMTHSDDQGLCFLRA
jgi:prolyl-tRNA synthetase